MRRHAAGGREQIAAKMTPAEIAEVQEMEREWKPKRQSAQVSWYRKGADQGFADAQYNLGIMYANGRGIPQDYVQAHKWLNLAADQGYATAQFNLGFMYAQGRGVPQDYVQAHMWLNLAAVNGDADAINNLDFVAAKMTPAQIAEAQKMAAEWKPKPEPER